MSTSTLCKNCQSDVGEEEICPKCFAPQNQRPHRFTIDQSHSLEGHKPAPTGLNLPDLETASFHPSSAISRTLTKMRGSIATGVLVVAVVLVGLFLGFRHEKVQAQKAEDMASAALEESEYEEAARLWIKASRHYDTISDETAQALSLKKSSEAYFMGDLYEESIKLLQQSSELSNIPCSEKTLELYRDWGDYNLEESREYLSVEAFEEAESTAQDALKHFTKGEASDQQRAEARRQRVLALIELGEFFEAKKNLNRALELEGESKANLQLSKNLAKRRAAFEKAKLADSKEHRYISDEEIPVMEVEKPIEPKRVAKRRSYYSDYRKPKPRRPRPSVGSQSAYPTGKRRSYSDEVRDNYRTNQPSTFRPAPNTPTVRVAIPKSSALSKFKKRSSKYKKPKSYSSSRKNRSSSSGPTRWSGVETSSMGESHYKDR